MSFFFCGEDFFAPFLVYFGMGGRMGPLMSVGATWLAYHPLHIYSFLHAASCLLYPMTRRSSPAAVLGLFTPQHRLLTMGSRNQRCYRRVATWFGGFLISCRVLSVLPSEE